MDLGCFLRNTPQNGTSKQVKETQFQHITQVSQQVFSVFLSLPNS